MNHAVQEIVDRLAARVGRPAVLEDRYLRLVAYSAHDQPVDEVRENSILQRHASAEVSRWLTSLGIRQARRPVRVPANPELRMLPRICVPIRHKDLLLGFLFFVDPDGSMSATELEWCERDGAALAAQLHLASVAGLVSSARLAERVRLLLMDSPAAAVAARDLAEEGIDTTAGVVVAVLQATADRPGVEPDIQNSLTEALIGSPRLYRRDGAFYLARKDHCVLVMIAPSDDDPRLRAQLDSLRAVAVAELALTDPELTLVIGIGGHRPTLVEAVHSYREARMAAMAAATLPGVGELARWSQLGVYQVAASLAVRADHPPVPHAGLRRLLDQPEALPLLETLETYLDAAGNAQLTAELLHLHRTSLYYRLQRVEQLAGTDLKDGVERLALHLSLKVARMTGQYAPRPGTAPAIATSAKAATPNHRVTATAPDPTFA
ncbi:MAG TPA: helix-turn-helix domain-containing protein [Natronosporangium sp.]